MRYKSAIDRHAEEWEKMSVKEKEMFMDIAKGDLSSNLIIEEELYYQSLSTEFEFEVFESRINSLMLYWKKNKEFIDNYIKENEEKLITGRLKSKSAEMDDSQEGAYYSIKENFKEYLYISVNSILYTLLETTLKNIVNLVAQKEEKKVKLCSNNKSYVDKYIAFLQEEYSLGICLNRQFYKELTLMRKVRNKFTHSLEDEMLQHMRSDWYNISNRTENSYTSYMNFDHTLKCFGIVCEIIMEIENAVCLKYPESHF
ncbi:hypothetical protein CN639_24000 [Bacillus toyonensis]|uniref:hypothetical protein n=1 Tax=Bacillus toyonensis TaxID=155322 RepID=UPI000BF238E1|nr:hypothetical protein [Bacillus toyonensis]MCU5395970.1 hypothetical protein [Bacillus toyonensis]PEM82916.1 hypothetical protein CN639_24000 [Bacillus toyonensis]